MFNPYGRSRKQINNKLLEHSNGEVPGTALVAQSWDSLITDRGNNPKGKGGLEIRVIFVRNT